MKFRLERVNEFIRREMGDMLQRDFSDGGKGLVTVTEVRTSKDLRYAKIFVSIFGKENHQEEVMRIIGKNKSSLQKELGERIQLRYTPSIHFVLDKTADEMDRLDEVFKKIHSE